MNDNFKEKNGILIKGHIKIHNPETGEIFIDKRNAIHYENMSIALSRQSLGNGAHWLGYMK